MGQNRWVFEGVTQQLECAKDAFSLRTFLINIFLENIMSEVFIDCADLGVNLDGYKLKDLRFADDIALIAGSAKDLQTLLNKGACYQQKLRNGN